MTSAALDEGITHNVCGVNGCLQCHCHDCVNHWQAKAAQLQVELDEMKASMLFWRGLKAKETDARLSSERHQSLLREALLVYGVHTDDCTAGWIVDRGHCTCGLQVSLGRSLD